MSEIKTKQTNASVTEFIDTFSNNEQKRQDGHALLKLMQDFTGYEAQMWGPSIIGFGVYHYKSDKSKQEGDWPLVGFSPRKAAISLYVSMGAKTDEHLLKKLGKFKMGKACIYVNKLADIDQEVLKQLMASTISLTQAKYGKL